MKIEILQKDLLRHIQIAQRAISSRTTIQILEGLLFEAKGNELTITSTDLELSIFTKTNCIVKEEGKIVINSTMIGNIIRKLPNEPIHIDTIGEKINLQCGFSKFELFGQDSLDYPPLPKQEANISIPFAAQTLKKCIRETVFAASLDETRPALTGVLFHMRERDIDFVALDGFRISRRKLTRDNEQIIKQIIPARAMNELSKILDKMEQEEVSVSFENGHIVFELEDTVVYSRLLEGKYINYESLMTEDYETKILVDKKDLHDAVERASLLAREDKTNLIRLDIEDSNINISSNSELGSVNEQVRCQQEGETLKIAFNAKYILDGIETIDSEQIQLLFNGSLSPCVMHPVDDMNYTYLVLPVRLAKE